MPHIIAVFVIGLVCLWGALCVLSIGGWFVHRNDHLHDPSVDESERPDFGNPGCSWRDPIVWVFAIFCWPVLVAHALDSWYRSRDRRPRS